MWRDGGGGGTAIAMQVRVSPMFMKRQQSTCEEDGGGGLKFEKNAGKTIRSTT